MFKLMCPFVGQIAAASSTCHTEGFALVRIAADTFSLSVIHIIG